ncbi:MAG: hypothetical protein AMXMBFR57_02610 [Acidimicrobiia bacterium]
MVSPLLVSTLLAAATWFSSGTVIVEIEESPVQPVAIRLAGPAEGEWPLDGRSRVVLAGLAPGEYAVTPVFGGQTTPFNPKVEVRAATLATLHVPTAAYGGVRFDADPGMCEPDDPWKLTSVSMTLVLPDGRQRSGMMTNVQAATPHCVRELGGLLPGRYQFQITPPSSRMPAFTVNFTVAAGKWTEERLAAPPVVVRGQVTYGGDPVSGITVGFLPDGTPATSTTRTAAPVLWSTSSMGAFLAGRTDTEGRFALAVVQPGVHQARASNVLGTLDVQHPSTPVNLAAGINEVDIRLGGARLRVQLRRADRHHTQPVAAAVAVQHIRGPSRTIAVNDVTQATTIDALPLGIYSVSATGTTTDGQGNPITLVASRVQSVTVAEAGASVVLELVERAATLEVVDAMGVPLDGASIVPRPATETFKTDHAGQATINHLAVGTEVTIRSRTWDTTCHVVNDQPLQRVMIPSATAEVLLSWQTGEPATSGPVPPGAAPRPPSQGPFQGARLSGIAGAGCAIPLSSMSVATVRVPRVGLMLNLPPGAYTITLADGREFSFTAPGRLEVK